MQLNLSRQKNEKIEIVFNPKRIYNKSADFHDENWRFCYNLTN
ncbi:hypothetical protein SAMN04488524_2206 [Pedobacter africanus]|uniref:Uncharacterized protein n=1 Tax=Pedobacter africanus TaxID=151894 RepID=A0A1W2BC93_9SPHI|nr:hypothetical protein SAMN04488524_2206 [Pedobacter africanus]